MLAAVLSALLVAAIAGSIFGYTVFWVVLLLALAAQYVLDVLFGWHHNT